ncbi:MAG: hypothetical protein IT327_11250 [Anaerolineae bacterium]|nr:hypothetical protein [Anaerolineae bacterium]
MSKLQEESKRVPTSDTSTQRKDPLNEIETTPNIHDVAVEAVMVQTGQQGETREILIEDESGITVSGEQQIHITYSDAYKHVTDSTTFVLNQLQTSYHQTRTQAQGWYRFSLFASASGFLLIGVTVIAVILGNTTSSLIAAIASAVPNAAAALFFVQSKSANNRVDAILDNLTEARETRTAIEIADSILDPVEKDKLRIEIVRKVLKL